MALKRARVCETNLIVSLGKSNDGPLKASNNEMEARSRYMHFSNRARGGDRSEMEKRMPLLEEC
jgi:hypothetical protein